MANLPLAIDENAEGGSATLARFVAETGIGVDHREVDGRPGRVRPLDAAAPRGRPAHGIWIDASPLVYPGPQAARRLVDPALPVEHREAWEAHFGSIVAGGQAADLVKGFTS